MVNVVVRARFGYAMPNNRNSWQVTKGDTGVLRWERHPRYARFVELLVVWDDDPVQKPRRIILSSLEVIGIQINRYRIAVVSG